MVRYPKNLIARTASRHLTIFMEWWLYKIPGAHSMPTSLLATFLARVVTLGLQIAWGKVLPLSSFGDSYTSVC